MKLSDMTPLEQAVAEHRADPEFRTEWDRLTVAREVANLAVAYRSEHGLSQRALASTIGVPQPQIARLEKAEHQPSFEILARLTRAATRVAAGR